MGNGIACSTLFSGHILCTQMSYAIGYSMLHCQLNEQGSSWMIVTFGDDDRLAWFRKKRNLIDIVDASWEADRLPVANINIPKELEQQPNNINVPILHDTFEETPQNPDEWKEPGVHGLLEALLNEAQDDFAIPYPQNAS
eukprot:gene7999-720_t